MPRKDSKARIISTWQITLYPVAIIIGQVCWKLSISVTRLATYGTNVLDGCGTSSTFCYAVWYFSHRIHRMYGVRVKRERQRRSTSQYVSITQIFSLCGMAYAF
ncbi:MAG: hypothetical protein RR383_05410 [Muribaculaceae bacterium]